MSAAPKQFNNRQYNRVRRVQKGVHADVCSVARRRIESVRDLKGRIPFFLVRIRLFEFLGTPDQVVVVGRPKAAPTLPEG